MSTHQTYNAPWAERYASQAMLQVFSPHHRYRNWRQMWVWLAESEQELGLDISDKQIEEMRRHIDDIDFDRVAEYEQELKHDVMAHIKAFADLAPSAAPIIHLGATSCDITDNADLIIIRQACSLLHDKMVNLINLMSKTARQYADLPCLGFTHLQSAQATTVGKRITLWLNSILSVFNELNTFLVNLPFRGIKGATGTAESFKKLFDSDYQKYLKLETLVAQKAHFNHIQPVSGQTYDRLTDSQIMGILGHLSEVAHKISTDLRLWQSMKEIEEPFATHQVGSSAMAYKRNPIKSERVGSLAKFVMGLQHSTSLVTATQWFERSLDDSANRRLSIPQGFLACDAILLSLMSIFDGIKVYPQIIAKNLERELPFLATEDILMMCVKKGYDRQHIHEVIRTASMQVSVALREKGIMLSLIDLLDADPNLPLKKVEMSSLLNGLDLCGFAAAQCHDFLNHQVEPILQKYQEKIVQPSALQNFYKKL
jgi:adenylosuccinate lyase